jgi:diaminopimelate epimerase
LEGNLKTEYEFLKMHGAGNDFIMLNDIGGRFEESGISIPALCASHRGIGADGLILIKESDKCDFRMVYFNKDGSRAEMCGNGARCAALFAHISSIANGRMTFETDAGEVGAEILDEGVRIDIQPVTDLRLNLELKGNSEKVGYAVCGVPHAAVITEDISGMDRDSFLQLSREIRSAEEFGPEGTNFNLVEVRSPNEIAYRTYERGVEDETLACGTASVAVSAITTAMGLTRPPVRCETSGGDILIVDFVIEEDGASDCKLTGPTVISFRGSFKAAGYAY